MLLAACGRRERAGRSLDVQTRGPSGGQLPTWPVQHAFLSPAAMHHSHHHADRQDNHYLDPDPVAPPPRRATRATRFAPVKLTEARLDAFHDVAHAALSGTVRAFVQLDGAPIDTQRWRYVRSRGGASVYYERRRANKRHAALLVAGTIKARLADVMEGLYMDSTEHTKLVQHQLAPRFADAEVLKVIEQRSDAQPFAFTGLKWASVKASASGMVSSRDFCYLEKVGVIDITGGRKLGYFIMQSVDLPECPPAPSSKALRTNLSLCYLFEETRNGLVGMYMNGSMELSGPKMLWKMSRTNFADIALAVAGAREIAYAKRCAALLRAKKRRHGGATPKQPRGSVCELCHSLPSFFERHRECAGCDKMSVCKKCRVKHDVLRREHKSSRRLAHATFCFDCMESVKNPTAAGAFSFSLSSSTSSGSHMRREQLEHEEDDEEDEEPVAPPRGFKPLYDDESPRGYKVYDDVASPHGFNNESISSTFESELFGYDEPEPDSERSLRMFTLKLQQQLEEVGYDELDASSRHEGLAILGSGEFGRDSDSLSCTSDDEITSSSCVSSLLSVETTETDGTNQAEDDYSDLEDDEEEILSVRPVRRSQQPPEMLEAQTLNADGTLRKQSTASTRMPTSSTSSPDELTRALLSRLEEASLVAEQTYEQLKRSQVFSRSSSRAQSTESSGYTL